MNYHPMQLTRGFTLVEAMIATLLASIMSISVISIYVNQTGSLESESQRDANALEANRAFDVVARLMRHAQQETIDITYTNPVLNKETLERSSDDIQIDFQLPAGFNVWPNNIAPFTDNFMRIIWENQTEDNKYLIRVRNSASADDLATADDKIIAGNNSGDEPRIINFDLWPMVDQKTDGVAITVTPNSGYLVTLTTRSSQADRSYTNPAESSDSLKHYRTHTVAGIITPRN